MLVAWMIPIIRYKYKEYTMALFEEKKVEGGDWEQNKLEDLTPENGTSIGFYLVETPMIEGEDAPFMVCNGLLLDLEAKSIEDMVGSAKAISFIPKSILQGDIEDENWNIGQVARLENSNRPGDLNKKGKKTRYFAWNIFIQNVPNDLIKQLKGKVAELQGTEATSGETPAKPKV